MIRAFAKNLVLYTAKYTGAFSAARYLTRDRLRILCYHGISTTDEHQWRPALYMTPEKFAERMTYLKSAGYPVLTLDEAEDKRQSGSLPAGATVITFDDGFKDFYNLAWPIMEANDQPSTLYVTTYHAIKQTPIFRLALSYLFWKADCTSVDLSWIDLLPRGLRQKFPTLPDDLERRLVRHAEINLSDDERMHLLEKLYAAFFVDWALISESELFKIVDAEEIRDMARSNVAIELHTHRHCLPEYGVAAMREIQENRAVLNPLVGTTNHFCYPSGIWSDCHLPILADADIKTATTCDEGLNKADQDPLTLKRFLDGSQVSQIRFEAEMCGFFDILRDIQEWVRTVRTQAASMNVSVQTAPATEQ